MILQGDVLNKLQEIEPDSIQCVVTSPPSHWVAQRLGRKWIGIELNPKYIKIAEKRFAQKELF